jgi:hypothetical protein
VKGQRTIQIAVRPCPIGFRARDQGIDIIEIEFSCADDSEVVRHDARLAKERYRPAEFAVGTVDNVMEDNLD